MAITYPLSTDFLHDFPGWTTEFEPVRRQEQSRQANGRTVVKDMGSPLWRLTAQSRPLQPNRLDEWRARLESLENGFRTFMGFPKSRCYPIAYPDGSWPTGASFDGVSANLHTIATDRNAVRLSALPAGFVLSVGDYIQIGTGDLHQVMEAATASGAGLTPLFEVRPYIWAGVATSADVSVKRPACVMSIVPGSVQTSADRATGRGVITFQAMEAR